MVLTYYQDSVAGSVIQATGMVLFEDVLRTETASAATYRISSLDRSPPSYQSSTSVTNKMYLLIMYDIILRNYVSVCRYFKLNRLTLYIWYFHFQVRKIEV